MPELKLTQLHYYPLKSTAGITVTTAEVEPRGLKDDRRWMLVDERGRFLTAREHPQLLKIQSRVSPHGLTLNAPAMTTLELSLPLTDETPRLQITLWRDALEAACAPPSASAWCSEFLGLPCYLVYMDAQREPLRSLSEYRRGKDRGIYFGQNLIPRKMGTLRVGDRVEII